MTPFIYGNFVKYLMDEEKEASTAMGYEEDVRRCAAWLKKTWPQIGWHEVNGLQLSLYLSTLKNPNYHNRVLSSLVQFFSYLRGARSPFQKGRTSCKL